MRTLSGLVLGVVLATGIGVPRGPARAEDAPVSLVDWLRAQGQDASFEARRRLYATRFPGVEYAGTAEQNLALLRLLREGGAAPGAGGGSVPMREWTVRRNDDQWRVTVDPAGQVISVDAPRRKVRESMPNPLAPPEDGSAPPTPPPPSEVEATILPTPPVSEFVSAAMLFQKAKQFDDGLYAAVEIAAQEGAGAFAGKKALLAGLRERLRSVSREEVGKATALPFAAGRLGGAPAVAPAPVEAVARDMVASFESDPVRSKPIGFYTWNDALRALFRQDRMLQTSLVAGPDRDALLRALRADPAARTTYERYLFLVEHLTNPFVTADLRPALAAADAGAAAPGTRACFVPPCRGGETEFVHRLERAGIDPTGVNVLDAYVRAIRDGKVSLAVRPDSGWYDRQQWAFEPLLFPERMPEGGRLRLSDAYRTRLEELFRGALALARETHIKNLEIAAATGGMLRSPPPTAYVSPALTVEPLPSAYLRRADAYRYVRALLEEVFGREALGAMHRLTASGPVSSSLAEEVDRMTALFTGAYGRSCREIGHPAGEVRGLAEAEAAFEAWKADVPHDPDVAVDARMMVPVLVDPTTGRTKVWLLLGWTTQDLAFDWVEKPKVTVRRAATGAAVRPGEVDVSFMGQAATACYPVVVEAWTTRILDRAEFRRLCDERKTKAAILDALQSR